MYLTTWNNYIQCTTVNRESVPHWQLHSTVNNDNIYGVRTSLVLKAKHISGSAFHNFLFYNLGVPEQALDGIYQGFGIVMQDT